MKKSYLILFFVIIPFMKLFSQWLLQNPYPTPYNLNTGYFISPYNGWIVGDYGTILKTTDSGLTWFKQEINTYKNLTSVFFLSEDIGFIGGDELLLLTTNSGSDWQEIEAPLPRVINGILFINDSIGYLIGLYDGAGQIHRTTDQGNTWSYDILYSQILQYIGSINSIIETDSNNLWAVNTGRKVLRSSNNGYNWNIIEDSSLIFTQNSIAAINTDIAWIVGGDYGNSIRIIKTTDGGESFIIQLSGNYGYLNSIKFFNDSCGIVVGNNGNIFITSNGGDVWNNIYSDISQNLSDVIVLDSNTCLVVGEKGTICKSTNKGNTWTMISQGSVNTCYKIFFIDNNIGWAVGGEDLLTTTDGGENWQIIQIINNSVSFKSIFFVDSQMGWATSHHFSYPTGGGDIYRTEDGGNTWTIVDDNTIPPINSLHFVNKDTGWAVGGYYIFYPHWIYYYGYVYNTVDGGISWIRQDTLLNNMLNDVHFIDGDHGWIAGNGILMHTTDGGTNWIKTNSYNLNSIYFIDNENGYAVGSIIDNRILKTTNGGVSWTERHFGGYSRKLYSVYFSSNQNGWAVGETGTICYSTNAGETWNLNTDLTSLDLFDVFFINDSIGWLSGENGLIVKTESGGITNIDLYGSINITDFLLRQNYPNPFNPKTIIEYSVPSSCFISLRIYDILGRKVADLISEYQNSGLYKKIFDGSSLSSGIYFYTLQIGNFSQTRKMILIK